MTQSSINRTRLVTLAAVGACMLIGGCASKMESGYGVGIQAERQAALDQAMHRDAAPDTPGMYLALIDRMQSQGLYFASLAHIDAYEQQYGESPDTILLRADALRQTGQTQPAEAAYARLADTPFAARGLRGLGLLAGQAGDFRLAAMRFEAAAQRAPTDAATLSDLGYAKLREGDIAGARVPLMKAAELAPDNAKIMSNVALFLLSSGQAANAQGLMTQQKFTPDVQQAIQGDAKRVQQAARTYRAQVQDKGGGSRIASR
ncbi:pilus assembly protein [Caballeronia sp. LP006]|uniref:pilus assembly protein n=1 Tax=Caballeronia sp. LP006 TaxID=3038552 RepID=UPI00285E7EED|nr:pilus assembly protein [Caballeronia sp. LP006]MDR5827579.1 pilus assembly protein [Caballeronia sp. LP006]